MLKRVEAVFLDQLTQPPFSHVVGGDLGHEIPTDLELRTHILQDQRQQVLMHPASPPQLDWRDLQPLLVDLGDPEGHRTGGESPHVHVVSLVGHNGHQLALTIDG